jgi:hypothetical protein
MSIGMPSRSTVNSMEMPTLRAPSSPDSITELAMWRSMWHSIATAASEAVVFALFFNSHLPDFLFYNIIIKPHFWQYDF